MAIEARGLSQRFGRRTAVESLTMTLPRGAITGFVGPNGVGKTTTIRMLPFCDHFRRAGLACWSRRGPVAAQFYGISAIPRASSNGVNAFRQ